ncbi:MAG: hypothetical protein ABI639_16190 [Thermoanaerobaculia bacterium]
MSEPGDKNDPHDLSGPTPATPFRATESAIDMDARAAILDGLNPDDLPNLAAFLAGYMHEDWQLDYSSPAAAAFAFAGDADLDDVEELSAEWTALVDASRLVPLEVLNQLLEQRFHAAWRVRSRAEIEGISQELERALRE